MNRAFTLEPDPNLDLVLERVVDVPRELVWAAWTTPEHICQWFCPRPWSVTECEIDLRPGGVFSTTMRSPEGELFPNAGCYLEVIPGERLIWTDMLLPGFRPAEQGFMTGILTLESVDGGTKYTAMAFHRDEETRKQHEEMGFHAGWSTALDQLVELVKSF
ncbi:SRPBCC family protein [Blastopirellula sp. JC732]|uniref:SRPBCC family protein n=1 Tax=Blastopirellula sediminis TaxID=2894196 RepID=A0A9X1SGZ5_9BACT|nr:SRPBCC family protein [Blastopirellula sediminis]MCC9604299.1 SRPBCC family protein [Blastopirellula sediminis]MCC9626819.1 SRPBCC family protein [Blastopirellula sediminis]